MKIIVIGGGIAGTTAAEEIRKQDDQAEITIIEAEPHRLYSRVLLKLYLKGEVNRDKLFLKTEKWYEDNNIELMTSTQVVELDTKNKFVGLDNGRELEYDKLIIAVGGEPRQLEENKRGICYLRTLDDADHLVQLMNEQSAGDPVAVVGGGFISLELVELFVGRGFKVRNFLRSRKYLSSALDDHASNIVAEILKEQGVSIHFHETPQHLIGDPDFEGIKTSMAGLFKLKILAVGIGLEPELTWLREVETNHGEHLEVDSKLQLTDDVYAIGDAVVYDDVVAGRKLSQANWFNSLMQGKTVGRNVLGHDEEFRLVSSYALNLFGHDIIKIGDTVLSAADKIEGIEHGEKSYTQKFIRDGRLVGVVLINRNQDRAALTKEIENK